MIAYYEQKPRDLYGNISRTKTFPPHLHNHTELIYVLQGNLNININGNDHTLLEGDLTVVFPNTIHSYIGSSDDNRTIVLICSSKLCEEYFSKMTKYSANKIVVKKDEIHQDAKYAINSLYNESKNFPDINISSKKALTELILSRVLPVMDLKKNTGVIDGDATSQVITYICDNFKKQLSLDTISHELGINKFYISRIFTNKIGVSFNDYINSLRVDFSKTLLQNTDLPIIEISNECGFETQRTFNRIFKKIVNTTPMEYRKKYI